MLFCFILQPDEICEECHSLLFVSRIVVLETNKKHSCFNGVRSDYECCKNCFASVVATDICDTLPLVDNVCNRCHKFIGENICQTLLRTGNILCCECSKDIYSNLKEKKTYLMDFTLLRILGKMFRK